LVVRAFMSSLWEGSCLVCGRVHVLFVGEFMSCLWEGSCLVCGRVHILFVGGFMSCLWEGSCLVCGRVHVLFVGEFMSCLWEGSCLVCGFVHVLLCCGVLCFRFVFLRLVYPMFPVSLDCPFLIAPSIFSNVYLNDFPILTRTITYRCYFQ
jgi:hypothetical protein